MIVIPPVTMTDAMLTSSTVAEPSSVVNTETTWTSGHTFTLGDYCIVVTANSHLLYQSLQASNTNNPPTTSPTYWLALGNDNRWAMFSLTRNIKTYGASPMVVVITPGMRIDSMAVMAMVADSVSCVVTSVAGGGTVYSSTINLSTRNVYTWYDYFFQPFTTQQDYLFLNIPPYTDCIVTLTFTRSSGNVACGACCFGSQQYIGGAQVNATSDVINFSTVTRDAFGNATMVPRRNIPTTNQNLFTQGYRIPQLIALQSQLNAIPAVWSGLDDPTALYFEGLLILGFYRTFTITFDQATVVTVNLVLEEV